MLVLFLPNSKGDRCIDSNRMLYWQQPNWWRAQVMPTKLMTLNWIGGSSQ